MTPELRRRIGRASADYQAFLKSLGKPYPKHGPLSEQARANASRAKTPAHRAKLSAQMKATNEGRKRVKARGVVAVIGWNGQVTQLK